MFGKLLRPKNPAAMAHDAWTDYRALLDALADAPGDRDLSVALAGRQTSICMLPFTEITNGQVIPPGFTVRPDEGVQDCLLTAQTLELLTKLIDAGERPSLLLPLRAELRFGWRQYDLALADLALAEELTPPELRSRDREIREFRIRAAEVRKAAAHEPQPWPELMSEIRTEVERQAALLPKMYEFVPPRLGRHGRDAAFESTLDEGLRSLDAELAAVGFDLLSWTEHRSYAERTGRRLVSGFWPSPEGAFALTGGVTSSGTRSLAVVSWFDDGHILETNQGRGRTRYARGANVGVLNVDATESLTDLLQLHAARMVLRSRLKRDVDWVPLNTIEAQDRYVEADRRYAVEHRLEHGLTEAEARGYPFAFPAFTVPLLQRTAHATIHAAHAEATGGEAAA